MATTPGGFQSSFMRQSPGQSVDAGALALDALASSQQLPPGRYQVEVRVNLMELGQEDLEFVLDPAGKHLQPCLPGELIRRIGLRADSLAEPERLDDPCVDLPALVPSAQVRFDGPALRLDISIPQIALRRDASNTSRPEDWDYGINAAFVNYQVSAQQRSSRFAGQSSSEDLYLNSGVNIGPWRLRSNQSLRHDEDGDREWTRTQTFLQRDLPGTHANMTLGETFTGGDLFRSVPIRGLLIGSDPGMLADNLQGYAPVIRGVANSRARLEVRQNGYPIYSTYVSPGAYQIDDLATAAGSGELEIILTEADGQVRRFTQPYATLGNLLRNGVWRFNAAVGRYNPAGDLETPLLWQGTLAAGTGWNSTLYGGLMASDFYRAGAFGIARDFAGIGALALDVTHSQATIDPHDNHSVQGMSYAVKYGKSFPTRTNLRFAGYRYSTEGYRDFDEALRQRSQDSQWRGNRRSRLEAAVYQNIGNASSLNLTFSQEDYWRSNYQRRQFQLSLNTQHRGVSYNLFASRSLSDSQYDHDQQIGLSVSVPLDFGRSTSASFDLQESNGRHSQRASLAGSLEGGRVNYRASLSNNDLNQRTAALAFGYQTSAASLGAGVTRGDDWYNVSANASGALLLHEGGIAWGPWLGETVALAYVPGIAGAGIADSAQIRTNRDGYALVPYLRPYRANQVVLDTDHLGPDVAIDNGSIQVVPRRGAVVKAHFNARRLNPLVLTGLTANGLPLPFGARISDANGQLLGIVGQAGQVLLDSGTSPQTLAAHWGEHGTVHCQLAIDPGSSAPVQGYRLQTQTCL